jgi:hypothetical protein
MVSASLEAEPTVGPLRKLARAGDWEGTASELLEMLVEVCGLNDVKRLPGGWPKAPNALSNRLKRLASALRQEGIDVKRLPKNTEGMHLWSVRTIEENTAGIAGSAVTRKNSRVGPAMNGNPRRCYDDHGNIPKPAPDKASGDDGDDGDLFPTQSNAGGDRNLAEGAL